jgi:aldehyde:ferredoxin oxidoreductase
MALAYATSDRGGCHLRSWPIGDELLATEDRMDLSFIEFKAELVKNQQDLFCTLPKRFFSEPLRAGPCRDRVVELDQLIEEYYLVRGWNESGVPEKDKLKELGVDSN